MRLLQERIFEQKKNKWSASQESEPLTPIVIYIQAEDHDYNICLILIPGAYSLKFNIVQCSGVCTTLVEELDMW